MSPAAAKRRVGSSEHGAARISMRGDERIEPLYAVAIKAVERFIEEPKRRTGCGNSR